MLQHLRPTKGFPRFQLPQAVLELSGSDRTLVRMLCKQLLGRALFEGAPNVLCFCLFPLGPVLLLKVFWRDSDLRICFPFGVVLKGILKGFCYIHYFLVYSLYKQHLVCLFPSWHICFCVHAANVNVFMQLKCLCCLYNWHWFSGWCFSCLAKWRGAWLHLFACLNSALGPLEAVGETGVYSFVVSSLVWRLWRLQQFGLRMHQSLLVVYTISHQKVLIER